MASVRVLVKVAVIGERKTGKSSLICLYVKGKFSSGSLDNSVCRQTSVTVVGQEYSYEIWDVPNWTLLENLGTDFWRDISGCVLVFDVTKASTFSIFDNLYRCVASLVNKEDFPLVVAGNMVDRDPSVRDVSSEIAQSWCQNVGALYFEVSAVTGSGVNEMFLALAERAVLFYHHHHPSEQLPKKSSSRFSLEFPFLQKVIGKLKVGQTNTMPLSGPIFIARFDYERRTSEDLGFKKGEKLEIIYTQESTWWKVRSLNSKREGYIPSKYVAEYKSTEAEDWFFGSIGRFEEERHLRAHNVEGTYMIRESDSRRGTYTLSVWSKQEVKRYRIQQMDNGRYFVMSRATTFTSIKELVDYYFWDSHGLCTRLTNPCPPLEKPQIDLSHKFQDCWEISRNSLTFKGRLKKDTSGEVFKGLWNRKVSVCIRPHTPDITQLDSFLGEIAALKKLCHPKLQQLYGVCSQEEPLLVITEPMVQSNMLDYLQGEGRTLQLPQLIDMASQVAAGMAYVEQSTIIHRDLAARNVLVGRHNMCKIANLGMAQLTNRDLNQVRWMAPEAALNNSFSIKSDIWSFGVLLTELVTHGQIPYLGMTNEEVLQLLEKGHSMPCPPNTPNSLHKVMLDTWKGNAVDRPTFEYLQYHFDDLFATVDRCKFDQEYH